MLKKIIWASVASLAVAAFIACTETNVAGGVSEETNTLAGVIHDASGKAAARTRVCARHYDVDTLVLADTTDENGNFALPLKRQGKYGLTAETDSSAYYETINYEGSEITVEGKLTKTATIAGVVAQDQGSITISIPGSPWTAETDSNGSFTLKGVPQGNVTILAKSPDPIFYNDAYYTADVSKSGTKFYGPFPKNGIREDLANASDENSANCTNDGENCANNENSASGSGLLAAARADSIHLPVSREYGLRSWWSMDVASESGSAHFISDVRGWTEGMLVYGKAKLVDGVENKALELQGANQYGVIENDRGILDSATQMVLEAWVSIDSVLTSEKSYRKNVVGKLGFGSNEDQDVFSLAVIDGECGAKSPRFAFFLADGSGDSLSCDNAAVANKELDYGSWVYVTAVWDGEKVSLYLDGELSAEKDVTVGQINISPEPIFFGKEAINLKLDDVRLGVKAIDNADVLYRYYLKEVQND